MSLQSIVRWLVPKEDHFYTFVERQAVVAHEAALALAELGDGKSAEDVSAAVHDLEHQGDDILQEMVDALARTFVTPLDREDLHRLSTELDDILDLTNDAARVCLLFGDDEPAAALLSLIDVLVRCTAALSEIMPKLRAHDYGEIIERSQTVRELEQEGDRVFRSALRGLFDDPAIDAKTLVREKEVLEDLERAIDHCEHVANTLANLSVKHG